MNTIHLTIILVLGWFGSVACSKSDDMKEQQQVQSLQKLPGVLYYEWADDGVYRLKPAALNKTVFIEDVAERNGWSISQNGQFLLECFDDPEQDYDAYLFRIKKIPDGTVVSSFKYYPKEGSLNIATGYISPDGSMIAIEPTSEEGIVIVDQKGNLKQAIEKINNEKVQGRPVWTPDNCLMFLHHQLLLKTNTTFNDATLIKELDFDQLRDPAISPDGNKIAFSGNGHVWTMDKNGNNLQQVTTSSLEEVAPEFSPDGHYLLVGANYHTTMGGGPWGYYYNLKAIPVDGKRYTLDDSQQSAEVINIQIPGEDISSASGKTYWLAQ